MALTEGTAGCLRWAVAERPLPGSTASGDAFIVVDRAQGALVAALDGLGHGPDAFGAVRAGVDVLRRYCEEPVPALLERCADAVRPTRGVVATVCSFDDLSLRLTWSAIGNVAGLLLDRNGAAELHRREVVGIAGIVGHGTPRARLQTVDVHPGSLLVLATDGIGPDFREVVDDRAAPADLASRILSSCALDRDDALVLVGRYEPLTRREG